MGVKEAALSGTDHVHHLLPGDGGLVDTLAAEGVVYVGQSDYLGPGRNLIPHQAVGIAPAVPALMVVPGDVREYS